MENIFFRALSKKMKNQNGNPLLFPLFVKVASAEEDDDELHIV
jgi:hypothetical protein